MSNKNDYRRLKEEADIRSVVDYCGIEKGRRIGSAQFVKCPNPNHEDSHPTNAYYRDGWNTIYCTTCNKNMGPIDIIMWTMGMSYGEAADALWELEGEPDWYYADRNADSKKVFTVSLSELELLQIKIAGSQKLPVRYTRYRELDSENLKKGYLYQFDGYGYCLVKTEHIQWSNFLSKEAMQKIVISKCKKVIKECDQIEKDLGATNLFLEKREKINELMKRAQERRTA